MTDGRGDMNDASGGITDARGDREGPPAVPTAWVVGASGAWGRAIALDLLRRGWDVVALGRREAPDLAAWAARLGRAWTFVALDLAAAGSATAALPAATPDALFVASAATGPDRAAITSVGFLGPAALIEATVMRMRGRGRGRIGVLVGQNGRLGMAGLGDFSAAQGALWTWAEALASELADGSDDVRLTVVIPGRTASATQRFVAERSGRRARLRPPKAGPLVEAVLAGRRRGGRRPLAAAALMAIR
jgi:short-subunit dehydrogenase